MCLGVYALVYDFFLCCRGEVKGAGTSASSVENGDGNGVSKATPPPSPTRPLSSPPWVMLTSFELHPPTPPAHLLGGKYLQFAWYN